MSEAVNVGKEPWITQLDKEIDILGEGSLDYDLAIILKQLILSDGDSTAADIARKIDNYYDQQFRPSDPLMRFEDDQGMGSFLFAFWQTVCISFARVIPYNNNNQEKLVQLVLELKKLPPRQFKISGKDCLVWTKEPYFGMTMTEHWNGFLPSHLQEERGGDGESSFEELCNEWVNFSSFIARTTEAGLNGDYYNYMLIDISHGLDDDLPQGLKRDCQVMVAAQYILLAGGTLAENCFKADEWRRWAEKLKEISKKEEGVNTRLASATEEAYRYMVSLHPAVFSASED